MNETLGWNLILIGNLTRTFLNEDQQNYIDSVEGDKWYPADKLIELLASIEKAKGSDKIRACGKGIYYTLKEKIEQIGVRTPLDAIRSIVVAYPKNNRGDSIGKWNIILEEEGHVVIEDNTIYDCDLGQGVVLGAVRVFGGKNVKVTHTRCKKKADDTCVNEVTWI